MTQAPVTACPCCGAASLRPIQSASALLAVCDVLVTAALESMGKRIVRVDRSRYKRLGELPWHLAHTLWRPDARMAQKGLANAWDVVPAMLDTHGCCGVTSHQVIEMLNSYVLDLLDTGTGHDVAELRYRFRYLGIDMLPHHTEVPHAATIG